MRYFVHKNFLFGENNFKPRKTAGTAENSAGPPQFSLGVIQIYY